jgi:hypothetical protein
LINIALKYRRRIHSITNQRGYTTVLSLRRSCIVLYFISNIKCQAFRIKYDSMLVRIVEYCGVELSRRVWILRYTNNHKVGNAEIDPIVVTRERGSGLGALLSAQLPKGGISYPHRCNRYPFFDPAHVPIIPFLVPARP